MHEAQSHDYNIFATFTYAPDHLPSELVPEHLSRFFKRVRKAAAQNCPGILGNQLRYLASGEYGDTTERPHYHAIMFGLDFSDKRKITTDLYQSHTLDEIWGLGAVKFGAVTHASAAYVAGYTTKSLGRTYADSNGVVKQAPFLRVSTRPGLGLDHLHRYHADYHHGFAVRGGDKARIPRYYAKKLQQYYEDDSEAGKLAQSRRLLAQATESPENFHRERLVAAEKIAQSRAALTRKTKL